VLSLLLRSCRAEEEQEYSPSYGEMMDWSRIDFYGLLGVDPSMPQSDLKRFYRRLSLQLHPDKNPDNKEEAHQKFVEVSQAFKVLGNAPRRKAYDKLMAQIPAAFRPKHNEKPVMELRSLILLFIFGISGLQYLYWSHRQSQILERMNTDRRWRNKLERAKREGKSVVITGAEPPDIEACLFFTLPFMPFYIPPYLFHLTRWVIENALLGREMSDGERCFWMRRQYGWTQEEYDEFKAEEERKIEEAGGIEVVMAQQKFREQKWLNRMKRWEKYGR